MKTRPNDPDLGNFDYDSDLEPPLAAEAAAICATFLSSDAMSGLFIKQMHDGQIK